MSFVWHMNHLAIGKWENCRGVPLMRLSWPAPSFRGQWFVIWSTWSCDYTAGKGTTSQENWNLPSEADNKIGGAYTGWEACVQWGHRHLNCSTRTGSIRLCHRIKLFTTLGYMHYLLSQSRQAHLRSVQILQTDLYRRRSLCHKPLSRLQTNSITGFSISETSWQQTSKKIKLPWTSFAWIRFSFQQSLSQNKYIEKGGSYFVSSKTKQQLLRYTNNAISSIAAVGSWRRFI